MSCTWLFASLGVADPKDPDDLIVPAREGAKRAVAAAIKAGVKRVVLTSSVAATSKGVGGSDWTADETVWTDPDFPRLSVYAQSKTLAESCPRPGELDPRHVRTARRPWPPSTPPSCWAP